MRKVLFIAAAILPMLSFGLLPPLYETLAEFKALINDERLPQALQSGEAITGIQKEDDTFTVTTNKSTLRVKVIHDPTKLMGPGKFHLEFPNG